MVQNTLMSSRSRSFNFSKAHFQKVKNLYIQAVPREADVRFFFGRVTARTGWWQKGRDHDRRVLFPLSGFYFRPALARIELRAVVLQQAGLMCAVADETPMPTRPDAATRKRRHRRNEETSVQEKLQSFLRVCVLFCFSGICSIFLSHLFPASLVVASSLHLQLLCPCQPPHMSCSSRCQYCATTEIARGTKTFILKASGHFLSRFIAWWLNMPLF